MFWFYTDQLKHNKTQQNVYDSTIRIYLSCIHSGFVCALQFLSQTPFFCHHNWTESVEIDSAEMTLQNYLFSVTA